jgi:hypothetical protein
MKSDANIEIIRIDGQEPRYDTWSVTAKGWIGDDRKHEKTLTLNVLKDNGNFDKAEDGQEVIFHRLKDRYESMLKEDPDYSPISVESLDEEHSKSEELIGEKRCV